jgi:murein DD-endopeptidase MepM/ murein hydrolase activator NlpD
MAKANIVVKETAISMRNTLYKYNAETCQYERVRVKTPDVIFYASGVVVAAILMLAAMLVLHDYLIDSDKETALRRENSALKKNHEILTAQLNNVEATLSSLAAEDEKLHIKFFGNAPEKTPDHSNNLVKRDLLLADASAFRTSVGKIGEESAVLYQRSIRSNSLFANLSSDKKELMENIHSIPSLQPIRPWDSDKLLSGFGMRVNPFHKGMYEHPGIDVAAPRGTEVIAPADGIVREIKRSSVQAGYGNFIEIDHGQGFVTRYAHLEEVGVRLGQKIKKGTVIATTGNSGGSIAPHLHYEILRHGKNVNPVQYMMEGLSSDDHFHLTALSQKQNQSLD